MTHQEIGREMLERIRKDLCETLDLAILESFPMRIEGRQMVMVLGPKKK